MWVVVDGRPGRRYDRILNYWVGFSPEGDSVAYGARKDGKAFLVWNGEEGERCEDLCFGSFMFGPGGKRRAHAAKIGGRWQTFVDGKAGSAYDEIPKDSLAFSPNGSRFAHVARSGGDWFVVIDGKEESRFREILENRIRFSRDGRQWAYGAREGVSWYLVTNGKRLPLSFERLLPASICFAGNSGKPTFAGYAGGKGVVYLNGQKFREHAQLSKEPWGSSSDGQTFIYFAACSDKWQLIENGAPKTAHVIPLSWPVVFSRDGKRRAFSVTRDNAWFWVVDDKETPGFDMDGSVAHGWQPSFSPDGRRFASCGIRQKQWVAVVDGNEDAPRGRVISNIRFSPDSQHYAYAARDGAMRFVVVDGKAGESYLDIAVPESGPVWDTASSLHYFARRGDEFFLVEENLERD